MGSGTCISSPAVAIGDFLFFVRSADATCSSTAFISTVRRVLATRTWNPSSRRSPTKTKDAPFANPAKGCGTRNFKRQDPLPERVRHPPACGISGKETNSGHPARLKPKTHPLQTRQTNAAHETSSGKTRSPKRVGHPPTDLVRRPERRKAGDLCPL
jgi:hypothetical protein